MVAVGTALDAADADAAGADGGAKMDAPNRMLAAAISAAEGAVAAETDAADVMDCGAERPVPAVAAVLPSPLESMARDRLPFELDRGAGLWNADANDPVKV